MDNKRQRRKGDETSVKSTINHALQNHDTSDAHDVIGIVVKISIDAIHSKAQVLIADKTIEESAYARVSLQGSDTVTASLAEVSVGDVLRFHGFQVTKHRFSKAPLVADFYSSWHEPQAGWTRLHRHGDKVVSCEEEDEAVMKRVQEVVEWFTTTKFNDAIPPLPCRRRRLSELHAPGMTSHVVARVASIDTTAAPQTGSRKRRRFLPLKKRQTTIAVLIDGNEVMPLLDCAAHEASLKRAIQSGTEVLLTNVVTCAAEEATSSREVVVRPTDYTCIVPMLNDSSASKPCQAGSTRETQCLSMTQDLLGASTTQTISSPLMNVYIDELGVSFCDGTRFVSPKGFASTMVKKTASSSPPRYREATLTLNDGLVVKADGNIMQTLCGSIDPESLLQDCRLRAHVTDLMRGLLEEQVTLTWTVEQTGDTSRVTKCFLPRL